MQETTKSSGRRPAWIWLIFIYYFLTSGWKLTVYVLAFSGAMPTTEDQQVIIQTLNSFDVIAAVLIAAANLYAALLLLLLRREALTMFVSVFAASLMVTIWHATGRDLAVMLGGPALVGLIIGYGIWAAVCLYTWRLVKKGVLS